MGGINEHIWHKTNRLRKLIKSTVNPHEDPVRIGLCGMQTLIADAVHQAQCLLTSLLFCEEGREERSRKRGGGGGGGFRGLSGHSILTG